VKDIIINNYTGDINALLTATPNQNGTAVEKFAYEIIRHYNNSEGAKNVYIDGVPLATDGNQLILPETRAYVVRVLTTGADSITDIKLTNQIIKNMVDVQIYNNCLFYVDSQAGMRKRSSGGLDYAVVAYDMSLKASDVSQSTDQYQPVITTNGLLYDDSDDLLIKSFVDADDGNARFPITNVITICAWIYLDSTVSAAGRVISTGQAWNISGMPLATHNNSLRVYAVGAGDAEISSQNMANAWYFIALTFDSALPSANFKLYVNNNPTPNGTVTRTTNLSAVGNQPLCIGNVATVIRSWKGTLDHISVFNKVLSQTELTSIFNLTKSRYGM